MLDLERTAEQEANVLSIDEVMHELLLDAETFPPAPLNGKWI
jgi:hypothetical protein